MSFISDFFKVKASPTEAKALFDKGMSLRDKVKITSAIEAIDVSRRQEVCDQAKQIIWDKFCTSRKEKIVNSLAAIAVSHEEWYDFYSNIKNITQGLRDPEDIASVLMALHTIPKEKRDFCNGGTQLFPSKMSAKDRVLIIIAFAGVPTELISKTSNYIGDLFEGLKDDEGKELIVKAIAEIFTNGLGVSSLGGSSFIFEAEKTITKTMTVKERVDALHLLAASPKYWLSSLGKGITNNRERLQLKRALEAVPATDHVDFNASRLVTETMGFEDRLLILNAIIALPADKRDIASYHAGTTEGLISDTMTAAQRVEVLNAIAALSEDCWYGIERHIPILMANMNDEDRAKIMKALAALPQEQQLDIFRGALPFIHQGMNFDERLRMLSAVATLPQGERSVITPYAHRLIREGMTVEEKLSILAAVAAVPSPLRFLIHQDLMDSANLSAQQIVTLLQTLPTRRQQIQNADLGNSITIDPANISVNPAQILLELSDKIATNQGNFPQVYYENNPGIDVGGLKRDCTTKLFKALCSVEQAVMPLQRTGGGEEAERFIPKITDPNPHMSQADQIKCYRGMGAIFGMALRGIEIRTGNHFHPVVFKLLHALTEAQIGQIPENLENANQIPRDIYRKIFKVFVQDRHPLLAITDEELVQLFPDGEADAQVPQRIVELGYDTKDELMAMIGFDAIVLPTAVIAKSMVQNAQGHVQWAAITPKILSEKIEGSLTKQQVLEALVWKNHPNQQTKDHLNRWIDEAPQAQLEKFVYAITGLPTLGSNTELKMYCYNNPNQLPVFHTCFCSMDLPNGYPDYPFLKQQLEQSLDNALAGSGIQLE